MPRGERNGDRQRRQKRNHHLNPLLPPRPKRPLTGYGQYLKDYFAQENLPKNREAMRAAADGWKNLSAAQRQEYNNRVAGEKEIYQTKMASWKAHRNALKKPATAYGLFVRVVWNRERGSGRDVGQMGAHAATLWRALPRDEQRRYYNARNHLMNKYREEMRRVRAGGVLNLNWMTEAMNEIELAQARAGAGDEEIVNEDGADDADDEELEEDEDEDED